MISFRKLLQGLIGRRVFITTTGMGEDFPLVQFEGRLVRVGIDFVILKLNQSRSAIINIAEIVELRKSSGRSRNLKRTGTAQGNTYHTLRSKINQTFVNVIRKLRGRRVVVFTTAPAGRFTPEDEIFNLVSGKLAAVGNDFIVIIDDQTRRRRVIRIPEITAITVPFVRKRR